MTTKAKGPNKYEDGIKIHPSPQVVAQLQELADKGHLAKTVPEVARILVGQQLMQLEKEGLIEPAKRKESD